MVTSNKSSSTSISPRESKSEDSSASSDPSSELESSDSAFVVSSSWLSEDAEVALPQPVKIMEVHMSKAINFFS